MKKESRVKEKNMVWNPLWHKGFQCAKHSLRKGGIVPQSYVEKMRRLGGHAMPDLREAPQSGVQIVSIENRNRCKNI